MRALLAIFALLAAACSQPPPIEISDVQLRQGIGARPGVAYMRIKNNSAQDDALLAVTSPDIARIELHTRADDKGVMRMRRARQFTLKSGAEIDPETGGEHLMLFGLREGVDNVTLTFVFRHHPLISRRVKLTP